MTKVQNKLKEADVNDRIWLIAQQPHSGLLGLVKCLTQEVNGQKIRFKEANICIIAFALCSKLF